MWSFIKKFFANLSAAKPAVSYKGKLAVIIGHGMNGDRGAYGVSPLSMYEWDYNQLVAKEMEVQAKKIGLPILVLNKKGSSTNAIGKRASDFATKTGCVIELHFNSTRGASGTETLYDTREPRNKEFSKVVQRHMVALFKKPDRGVKDRTSGRGGSNLASVTVTSCLVEPLFGDTSGDVILLKSKRNEYAKCLVDAAAEFLR